MRAPDRTRSTPHAPRFHVHFRGRVGLLELERVVETPFGRLDSLSLSLGKIAFPIDVRAGAITFRDRRTVLEACSLTFEYTRLESLARDHGIELELTASDEAVLATFCDELGVFTILGRLSLIGPDLAFQIIAPLAVQDAPLGPLARLARLMFRAGFVFDAEHAAFVLPRAITVLLADVVFQLGFRIPEWRGGRLEAKTLAESCEARLEASRERGDLLSSSDVRTLLHALASDDLEMARRVSEYAGAPWRWIVDIEFAERDETLRQELRADTKLPLVAVLMTLRIALRSQTFDLDEVLRSIARLESLCRSRMLLADVQQAFAARLTQSHPEVGVELLARAVRNAPHARALVFRLFQTASAIDRLDLVASLASQLGPDVLTEAERLAVARDASLRRS